LKTCSYTQKKHQQKLESQHQEVETLSKASLSRFCFLWWPIVFGPIARKFESQSKKYVRHWLVAVLTEGLQKSYPVLADGFKYLFFSPLFEEDFQFD